MSGEFGPLPRSRVFESDRTAWLVCGVVALAALAWWFLWPVPVVPLDPPDDTWTRDFRLTVLRYGQVVERPDGIHVDAATLASHLRGLRDAGYRPVRLEQASAAYAGGAPLPARAVLLQFDGGFLSTYRSADPVLRELRWPATMFLETSRQVARDTTYLYWRRLSRMHASGLWELGVHGHGGDDAPSAIPARFAASRDLVERRVRRAEVFAVAPMKGVSAPLGEVGQPDGSDPFALGFEASPFGVNDRRSDPLRLERLAVDPGWSADLLVAHVDAAISPPPIDPLDTRPAYVAGDGRVIRRGDEICLEDDRRADLWLTGGRWADGWELTARVRRERGQFWVLERSASDARHWRWGTDGRGTYLQERTPGAPPRSFAREDPVAGGRDGFDLRVVKRGRGLWAEIDGRPFAGGPQRLPGVGTGDPALVAAAVGDGARVCVETLRFRHVPAQIRRVAARPDADEIRALVADADTVSGLAPPWLSLRDSTEREAPLDARLFAILRERYAWHVVPRVEWGDTVPPADAWLAETANRAARAGWDGLTWSSGLNGEAADVTRARLERFLEAKGMRLHLERNAPSEES